MGLTCASIWVSAKTPHSHLGVPDLQGKRYGVVSELKLPKREFCCLAVVTAQPITHLDDEKVHAPGVESSSAVNPAQEIERRVLPKDLSFLPKPLSASDLTPSPDDGRKVRVAYQGIAGAYSEAAALKVYPDCETVPCDQFESTFQALAQCEMTLSKLGLIRINADDTAGAAQIVALSGEPDTGAIASSQAAEIYGLDILAEKIQDSSENFTRFLILAREPIIPGMDGHYKTSIVFALEEGPGMLFKALAVFAMRDINLSKIESRPQQKRPVRVVDDSNKGSPRCFDYLFYVDFEASMAEPRAQDALGHLQELATFLRVLGCYPRDTSYS